LFAVSALLMVAGVFNDPPWKWYHAGQTVPQLGEAAHVAASLVEDGTFANPFAPAKTGPTAHVAPAFPFLQFLVVKLFGSGAAGWLALRWLPTLALCLQFALLPYAARWLGFSAGIGVLAAIIGLAAKPGKEELWEAHLAGLAFLLLTLWVFRSQRYGLLGLLAGLVVLLQPVFGAVYAGFVAWLRFSRCLPARSIAILIAVPMLVCIPWMARNYITLGSPALRDNLGYELHASFNDCAPYGVRVSEKIGCVTTMHPNDSLEQALEVQRLGEVSYNRVRMQEALAWITDHLSRTTALLAQRTWFFWFPSDEGLDGYRSQSKRKLFSHVLTLLSVVGLVFAFRNKVLSAPLLAMWLALFPLIYYAVQFETRYRYPILWVTWLLAAYACGCAYVALATVRRHERS
jgi:hypothetical protein